MNNILQVENLDIGLEVEKALLPVVKDVEFSLEKGKVLGIVGESGCGKSVTCLSLLRLLSPAFQVVKGQVNFKGRDLLKISQEEMRKIRGREIALIMQNPMVTFNPVLTIGQHFIESLEAHLQLSKKEARTTAIEYLASMNLPHYQEIMSQYPFQLSGGMLQRVMIAIALSMSPSILLADEPTTALDATVQYQILAEMSKLQEKYQTAILLVTHDLSIIAQLAEEVVVMYYGQIVERAPVMELFNYPLHPYTQALMESRPGLHKGRLKPIEGQVPALADLDNKCPFLSRCKGASKECSEYNLELMKKSENHLVRCIKYL